MGRPPLKKGAIERSALELFVEKGIDGTSIRDIAQRAGVTEGALYRHHRSKDDLARYLYAQSFAKVQTIVTGFEEPGSAIADRLKVFITELFRAYEADSYSVRYVLASTHLLLDEVRVGERDVEGAVTRGIRAAASGASAQAAADLKAQLIIGMVVRVMSAVERGRLKGRPTAQIDPLTKACVEILK